MRNAHATPELDDRHVGSPGHGAGGDFQHHSSRVGWLHLKVSPATGEQKGWRNLERGFGCLEGEGVLTTHLTSISRWRLFRRGLHCSLANLRLQCTYSLLTVTRTDKCVQQFYVTFYMVVTRFVFVLLSTFSTFHSSHVNCYHSKIVKHKPAVCGTTHLMMLWNDVLFQ